MEEWGLQDRGHLMVKELEDLTRNLSPSLHPYQCLPLVNTPGAGEAGHRCQSPSPAQAREGCRMVGGSRGRTAGESGLSCPPLQGQDSLLQAVCLGAEPPFPS